MPAETPIQLRRGAKATWSSVNPTLLAGEVGFESDTGAIKVGDGTTAWNSLAFPSNGFGDVRLSNPNAAYFSGSGLVCGGSANTYAVSVDSVPLSITGDIDIKVKVKLTDWTPAATQTLVAKWGSSIQSYRLYVATDGTLNLNTSTTGADSVLGTSTVATGITDGTTKWVRATLDVNDGAGNRVYKFYTSDDGTTWTQLGTTVTTAGTTSIFNSNAALAVGGEATTNPIIGTIYEVLLQSAYDTANNTTSLVYDADFAAVTAEAISFTESSANAATVSIIGNRYSYGIPGTQLTGTSNQTRTINRTNMAFFCSVAPVSVDMCMVEVTVGGASTSTYKIAIYKADSNGQAIGNPVIDFGSISVTTSNNVVYYKQITPVTLKPGSYLMAANASVAFSHRQYDGGIVFLRPPGSIAFSNVYLSETNSAFPSTSPVWDSQNAAASQSFPAALRWWPLT